MKTNQSKFTPLTDKGGGSIDAEKAFDIIKFLNIYFIFKNKVTMNHSNAEMRIFENKMGTLLGTIKELNVSENKSSLMFEKKSIL